MKDFLNISEFYRHNTNVNNFKIKNNHVILKLCLLKTTYFIIPTIASISEKQVEASDTHT